MGAVLKSPAQDQCTSLGLEGCPELTEGVLAYVEGDQNRAVAKLVQGAAKNQPAKVQEFANALRTLSSLPGAEGFAQPMNEVASLLAKEAEKAPAAPAPVASGEAVAHAAPKAAGARAKPEASSRERSPGGRDDVLLALSAPIDPSRAVTESVAISSVETPVPCEPGGVSGTCIPRRVGPMIVTDILAMRGCPDRLVIGSTSSRDGMTFRWLVDAGVGGIHGPPPRPRWRHAGGRANRRQRRAVERPALRRHVVRLPTARVGGGPVMPVH